MKLDHLYSLRREFTVIGLTGRTGSGCTTIANLLCSDYKTLEEKGLRKLEDLDSTDLFYRKYSILKNYVSHSDNWIRFSKIKYKNVIILFLFHKHGNDLKYLKKLLSSLYKEQKNDDNSEAFQNIFPKITSIHKEFKNTINRLQKLDSLTTIREEEELKELSTIFFGKKFRSLCSKIFDALGSEGHYRGTNMLHHIACNIRQCGDPIKTDNVSVEHIYTIASVINRIIKAKKHTDGENSTKIVIDSLRNSLEIMFFKERYSAFYMLATKDVLENSKTRIIDRLSHTIEDPQEQSEVATKILELDAIEYKTGDFAKGKFYAPDVENCIQKSDFHILNLKLSLLEDFLEKYKPPFGKHNFLTREEQLLKLIALINQPGIITPSAVERCMQVANTAKLNSGCISRNVGAAITDEAFHVKSIGWNDVAKGHTPCNLRNVEDLINNEDEELLIKSRHYSPFEKGNVSSNSAYKYKGDSPGDFKEAIKDYFADALNKNKQDLNGKNCSFCFKTVHNHYEGEANQVHTRSLHAEENAMLQITKLGGQGVAKGILFTTASPCELCSKKAYQLGIRKIFYIDPYPGISNDQILTGGREDTVPVMMPFSGGIGNAYHKLYDSFMSYKDEVSMTLENKSKNKVGIQFKYLLNSLKNQSDKIKEILESNENFTDEEVIELLSRSLKNKDI